MTHLKWKLFRNNNKKKKVMKNNIVQGSSNPWYSEDLHIYFYDMICVTVPVSCLFVGPPPSVQFS